MAFYWIIFVCFIHLINANQEDIRSNFDQLIIKISNSSREFSKLEAEIKEDIEEVKELTAVNQHVLKSFKANQLENLINNLTNSSNLDNLIKNQEHVINGSSVKLSEIIEKIMEMDRKLDTWDGNSNEIFNEFEAFLDLIPIGLLSIFIIFIILKIIVARQMNDGSKSQDKIKLVEAEAEQARDNPPVSALDYEQPIQYPEQKYLNLTVEKKEKDEKRLKSKSIKEDKKDNINTETPIFFGLNEQENYF